MQCIVSPVFGLSGNFLTIILLRQPRLKNHPTSFFMVMLAIADSLTVTTGLLMMDVPRAWGDGMPQIYGYCLFTFYAHRIGGESSGWILAVMSVERCLAITMPLKSMKYRSKKINKIVVLCVLLMVSGLYSYGFFILKMRNGLCYENDSKISSWVRFTIDYVILILTPAALIVSANMAIICSILKSKSHALKEGQRTGKRNTRDSSRSLIFMLIAISVAFFVLKTPFHILYALFQPRGEHGSPELMKTLMLLSIWAQYLNHCINFYLYILSGSEFRAELINLLRRLTGRRPRDRNNPSQSMSMSATVNPQSFI